MDVAARVEARPDEEFFLSVVTASELLHGVHRAVDRSIRARRSAFVEAVLAEFPLLGIDLLTARTHAQLWAELSARGQPIGAHDLWLAATCVGRGFVLATGNERELRRVPGLEMEVWSSVV
jgi:predicted nucleic acid-binding protein